MHDVGIVGAGPAGLNAAGILGRCGRDVIVYDSGQPRNAASRGLHGFLTRDGVRPQDLRQLGRAEIQRNYPSVSFVDAEIATISRGEAGFHLVTTEGRSAHVRMLLLATGRVDVLPATPGFREYYGRGVHHCPYCDAWEHRGGRIAVYGDCPHVVDFALTFLTWTTQVTLCAADPGKLTPTDHARLRANGVCVAASTVSRLSGDAELLKQIHFTDGSTVACDALFFTSELPQKSPLAQSLGCKLDQAGSVVCQAHAATGVPGLYVAGNVRGGVHLAIMAAAEGAEAAITINEALADQELRKTADGVLARNSSLDQRPGAQIPTK